MSALQTNIHSLTDLLQQIGHETPSRDEHALLELTLTKVVLSARLKPLFIVRRVIADMSRPALAACALNYLEHANELLIMIDSVRLGAKDLRDSLRSLLQAVLRAAETFVSTLLLGWPPEQAPRSASGHRRRCKCGGINASL